MSRNELSMEMLTYSQFVLKETIRRQSQLLSPPLQLISKLELPNGSIFHNIEQTEEGLGISQSNVVVASHRGQVFAENIMHLSNGATQGHPMLATFPLAKELNEYWRANHRIHKFTGMASLNTQANLLVENYEVLKHQYHYATGQMAHYNQWLNYYVTVVDNIIRLGEESDRQQFLIMTVPNLLPPPTRLNAASENMTSSLLRVFYSNELLYLLDFWECFGPYHERSQLSRIPDEIKHRLNIIWQFDGHFTVMNLATVLGWIKFEGVEDHNANIAPLRAQKLFLRMLMSIKSSSAADDPDEIEAPTPIDPIRTGITHAVFVKASETVGIADDEPDIHTHDVDADMEQLENLHNQAEAEDIEEASDYKTRETPKKVEIDEHLKTMAEKYAQKGILTAAEVKGVEVLSKKFKAIKNPFGEGLLHEYLHIDKETLVIPENTPITPQKILGVTDLSMMSSSLKIFNEQYLRETFNKDIAKMALHVQKAGFIVTAYEVEKVEDLTDNFEVHSIRVQPIKGKASTLRFRVPKIHPEGTFKANGVKCFMKRQRVDIPIRKVDYDEVALTSYYKKIFVTRADRAVFNYQNWLSGKIVSLDNDPNNAKVTNVHYGNSFDREGRYPTAYTGIAMRILRFQSGDWAFYFDGLDFGYKKREHETLIAFNNATKHTLWMRNDNSVVEEGGEEKIEHGFLENFLGIETSNRPVDVAMSNVMGAVVPLGVVMAHHIGLGNLIKTLGASCRRVERNKQLNLTKFEYTIRFEDETLVLDSRDIKSALLLNGFNMFKETLKHMSVYLFDRKDAYSKLTLRTRVNLTRTLKDYELMFDLWVDHITEELLIEMNEPTDLFDLFIRAVEMISYDTHPEEMAQSQMRDRGYERMAGMVYTEMMNAVRVYKSKAMSNVASLDLNPEKVWYGILNDPTVGPVEDSNPIQALKDMECVVYRGGGGRNSRAMTDKSRMFNREGMGVISEATVDNGDVATVTFTSADPMYTSVRGMSRRLPKDADGNEIIKGNATKIISTSFSLGVGLDHDDAKRIGFASIQNSQLTHSKGSVVPPARTGQERVMALKTPELYSSVARQDGRVMSIGRHGMVIEYKDGTKETIELGRRFGNWSGRTIPHNLVTHLEFGSKFKEGDVIAHNDNFFKVDKLSKDNVIYKAGVMALVTFQEVADTFEDGSSISQSLADALMTTSTHTKDIKVSYEQELMNLIKVGSVVSVGDILCTIVNPLHGDKEVYDDAALATLNQIGRNAPRTKYSGKVEHIEVIYTGDVDEMSDTLKHITQDSDDARYRKKKELKRGASNGMVAVGYRVDNIPMDKNTAIIRIYITGDTPMGTGDKLRFGNQMKSVVGPVFPDDIQSEISNQNVQARFSYMGPHKRIVLSLELSGSTNAVSMEVTKQMVGIYDS